MSEGETKVSMLVHASPNEVYATWLDERKHSAMASARVLVQPWVGGRFGAWDGKMYGNIVTLDVGKAIRISWRTSDFPVDAKDMYVEFQFLPVAGGTKITVRHVGVPESAQESYKNGWKKAYLDPMKRFFGKPGAMREAFLAVSRSRPGDDQLSIAWGQSPAQVAAHFPWKGIHDAVEQPFGMPKLDPNAVVEQEEEPTPAPKKAPKKVPAKAKSTLGASSRKTPAKKAPPPKAPSSKTTAKKAPVKKATTKKAPAKKAPAKKTLAKKAPSKKTTTKKAPAKKAAAKKAPSSKTTAKKAPAKKAATKKAPAKKAPAKKITTKKAATKKTTKTRAATKKKAVKLAAPKKKASKKTTKKSSANRASKKTVRKVSKTATKKAAPARKKPPKKKVAKKAASKRRR